MHAGRGGWVGTRQWWWHIRVGVRGGTHGARRLRHVGQSTQGEAVADTCRSGRAGRGTQVKAVAGTCDAHGSMHAGRGGWVRT